MNPLSRSAWLASSAAYSGQALPRQGPGEEADEDEEGLALPVNPDQGTPLVPDEEGGIVAPS